MLNYIINKIKNGKDLSERKRIAVKILKSKKIKFQLFSSTEKVTGTDKFVEERIKNNCVDRLFFNSSVIDLNKSIVLCKADLKLCKNQPSAKHITDNIKKYKFYPAKDGTYFNLYWDDRWKMTTTNSFDVSNMRFLSELTYFELLENVSKKYYNYDIFAQLDKNKTYDILLQTPELHFTVKEPKIYSRTVEVFDLQEELPILSYKELLDHIHLNKDYGIIAYSKNRNGNYKDYHFCNYIWEDIKNTCYSKLPKIIQSLSPTERRNFVIFKCAMRFSCLDRSELEKLFPVYFESINYCISELYLSINTLKDYINDKKRPDGKCIELNNFCRTIYNMYTSLHVEENIDCVLNSLVFNTLETENYFTLFIN